jgi:predicted unusual protein kinase regulating ubiquinone biosynthesis (AarF/ABC1/UbiB family)
LNAESSKVVANRERLVVKTRWDEVVDAFWHVVRFFQLWLIFLPPILTLPLVFFKNTENLWYDMFVTAVERAGVVWIKAFQYLSHRRDIIGP